MNEPGVGIVLGKTVPANDSLFMAMHGAYQHHMKEYVFTSQIPELYYGYTSNMAARRELFGKNKPFNERRRGGDTVFVRQSVDKYSCNIVKYYSRMQVRHLEMNSIARLYMKMFIYGRSRGLYSHTIYVRPLTMHERLSIFCNTKREEKYSLPKSAMLFALLSVGWVFSKVGNFSVMQVQGSGR